MSSQHCPLLPAGVPHGFPVSVRAAALLRGVLGPPQRQREAGAAGHRHLGAARHAGPGPAAHRVPPRGLELGSPPPAAPPGHGPRLSDLAAVEAKLVVPSSLGDAGTGTSHLPPEMPVATSPPYSSPRQFPECPAGQSETLLPGGRVRGRLPPRSPGAGRPCSPTVFTLRGPDVNPGVASASDAWVSAGLKEPRCPPRPPSQGNTAALPGRPLPSCA